MIKAIETSYKNCLFRSRLEARWAVFFDGLGIKWEYEPEGFEMSSGKRYLPDFWLPEYKVWFEVKSEKDLISDYETDKMVEFISESESNLILCIGQPQDEEMYLIHGKKLSERKDIYEGNVNVNKNHIRALTWMFHFWKVYFYPNPLLVPKFQISLIHNEESPFHRVVGNAYQQARSARFESGERK
jgi:hypothetical protein